MTYLSHNMQENPPHWTLGWTEHHSEQKRKKLLVAGLVGGSAKGPSMVKAPGRRNRRAYRSPAQTLLKTLDYQVLSWHLLVVKTLV